MSNPIETRSEQVDAMLVQLRARLVDMSPVLLAIGEDMVERIKQRFASATGPDGTPWAPNTQVTLIRYLEQRGGAFSKKTGKISAKGQALASGKRPLQGPSGDLAREINSLVVGGDTLVVSSPMVYAAMQQYGGTKSRFPNLWGDIQARPFFPVTPDGKLYPQEEGLIVEQLRRYLTIGGS